MTACRLSVGDRLAHVDVVQRWVGLIEADVTDVERRALDQLQLGVGGDRVAVDRVDEVVAVDLAGLQRLQPGGVVGDRPEDQLIEEGRVTQ